jgi:hypothetical protein
VRGLGQAQIHIAEAVELHPPVARPAELTRAFGIRGPVRVRFHRQHPLERLFVGVIELPHDAPARRIAAAPANLADALGRPLAARERQLALAGQAVQTGLDLRAALPGLGQFVLEALEAGADVFVSKADHPEKLLSAIAEVGSWCNPRGSQSVL